MKKLSVEELKEGLEEYFSMMGRNGEYGLEVAGFLSRFVVLRIHARYLFYSCDMDFIHEFITDAGYSYYITAASDDVYINITDETLYA